MVHEGAFRILIADDEDAMATMIAEELEERGYECVAVPSGLVALEHLRSGERFDAIITDLRMPDVDGLRLLRAARAIDPRRPVIMMTGHGAVDTALEAARQGAAHYLTKPFRLAELVSLLESALKSREPSAGSG